LDIKFFPILCVHFLHRLQQKRAYNCPINAAWHHYIELKAGIREARGHNSFTSTVSLPEVKMAEVD
jgi:hypothetical protein